MKFIIYFLFINCLNLSFGWIYDLAREKLHSPCKDHNKNGGFCVPSYECCSNHNIIGGNCAVGKLCCPYTVHCQDCTDGYVEIDEDCVDADECNFGVCSGHKCYNIEGEYECECFDGFEMIGSLKTCEHTNTSNTIDFLITQSSIISSLTFNRIAVKSEKLKMLFSGTTRPKSIDYSFGGNYMAWTDITLKQINFGPVNYHHPSSIPERITLRNLIQPYLLSIDWIHHLIYWTDLETKAINVLNINRPYDYYTVVKITHGMSKDFKVNVMDSCLVWTFVGLRPRIMRSLQDGSNQKILYSSDKQPFYITIDILLNRYFFVDSEHRMLYSIDFNGKDEKAIRIHSSSLLSLIINSPVIYSDDIYLLTDSKLLNINKFGFDPQSRQIFSNISRAFDFKIIDPLLQPSNVENRCLNSKCSHICVPSDQSRVFRCLCPQFYTLFNDSICAENQLENYPIVVNDIKVNFGVLVEQAIDNSLGSLNKSIKHQIIVMPSDSNDGDYVILVFILLSLVSLILINIFGFRVNLMRFRRRIPSGSQGIRLREGSVDTVESRI